MDYYERRERESGNIQRICWYSIVGVVVLVCLMLMSSLFSGCKTITKTEVVEKVRIDTLKETIWQKDSVWIHDSIYIHQKGDTVLVEKWHTKYIERQVHDTCFVTKTDSVAVPYPVKEKLTIKDKFNVYLQCMGIVFGILLVFIVIWLVTKWRHKQIVS